MKAKNKVTQIMLIILFIILAVITLFPIYFMAIASFKDTGSLFKDGLGMVFQFDNSSRIITFIRLRQNPESICIGIGTAL